MMPQVVGGPARAVAILPARRTLSAGGLDGSDDRRRRRSGRADRSRRPAPPGIVVADANVTIVAPSARSEREVRAFIADAFLALEDEAEQERMLDAALGALGDMA